MLNQDDQRVLEKVQEVTSQFNRDNITRTKAYAEYYERNPEIKWAFLASMVSRNAGWNMCDLEGEWFPKILSKDYRKRLFLTYERANWLIFSDAFPQLCIYEESKIRGKKYFHLLPLFSISPFMLKRWESFWNAKDEETLMTSLIINEQNLIQKPVIEHPIYHEKVFNNWLFLLQDWLHFSTVLFPTEQGHLFGCSVHDFKRLTCRIKLGKNLASILFNPNLHPEIHHFSTTVEHTGSRRDYEQFLQKNQGKFTPQLRDVYPVIHHHRHNFEGWEASDEKIKEWMQHEKLREDIVITEWYMKKQQQLQTGIFMESKIQKWLSLNKLDPSRGKDTLQN